MWRFAAGKAAGTSHVKTGVPCQDDYALTNTGNCFIAALADGAGSAPMADRGAAIAVATVLQSIRDGFDGDAFDPVTALKQAALAARHAVVTEAETHQMNPGDFASTLLAVIVGPQGGAAIQIGDGVIVVGDDDSDWSWVFWPQHGEYVNTTHFLTDDDAESLLQVEPLTAQVLDVALMSDGLERLSLQHLDRTVYRPFFAGLFEPLLRSHATGEMESLSRSLEDFLRSEALAARTDDDLSLVIATRRES